MKIFEITFFGITIAPSYYGLFYAISFLAGYYILKKRKFLDEKSLDSLILYIFFGVIFGGRIGYILFYDLSFYLSNPSEIFKFWHGGMSFHGGVIGVILAMILFSLKFKNCHSHENENLEKIQKNLTHHSEFISESKIDAEINSAGRSNNIIQDPIITVIARNEAIQKTLSIDCHNFSNEKSLSDEKVNCHEVFQNSLSDEKKKFFFQLSDEITSVLPIGLGLGRIANYMNKELLGKTYSGILAVEKNGITYFPSPLLEAFLEGLILFFILKYLSKKTKFYGNTAGGFLIFYSIFRFLVEFIRLPDPQIGYIFNYFTMGQILSIPMFLVGLYFLIFFKKYAK